MNESARIAINQKSEAWKKYRKHQSDNNYLRYILCRNKTTEAVREAKKNFEIMLAEEVGQGQLSGFYAYARSKTTIKETINRVEGPDGLLTNNIKDTTDAMNKTFQSVFVKENLDDLPHIDQVWTGDKLVDVDFSQLDTQNFLNKLNEDSAPGPDVVHSMVLSKCAINLSNPLQQIFRSSLDEGVLPDDWKIAHVTPIYKGKGKKQIL